ncbi:MAG: metal-dependent transcriptional regulator [Clostridiales bacterium]|nr:metal-dependent transcriptional regulator [Clostridiales bacterium]
MKIHESAENYLETILILEKRKGAVRSIDIANELEYTKPSVSVAMKQLRLGEYIDMDKSGYIVLREKGRAIAERMYERHTMLTGWLKMLGVSDEVASEDACKIEHVISAESFEAIKSYVESQK